MSAAGLSGTLAGQRAWKLFQKIEAASIEISKKSLKPVDEVAEIIVNKYKTTDMDVDQAIESTRLELVRELLI